MRRKNNENTILKIHFKFILYLLNLKRHCNTIILNIKVLNFTFITKLLAQNNSSKKMKTDQLNHSSYGRSSRKDEKRCEIFFNQNPKLLTIKDR